MRRQVMLMGPVGRNQIGSVSARAEYFPMGGKGGRMQKYPRVGRAFFVVVVCFVSIICSLSTSLSFISGQGDE